MREKISAILSGLKKEDPAFVYIKDVGPAGKLSEDLIKTF